MSSLANSSSSRTKHITNKVAKKATAAVAHITGHTYKLQKHFPHRSLEDPLVMFAFDVTGGELSQNQSDMDAIKALFREAGVDTNTFKMDDPIDNWAPSGLVVYDLVGSRLSPLCKKADKLEGEITNLKLPLATPQYQWTRQSANPLDRYRLTNKEPNNVYYYKRVGISQSQPSETPPSRRNSSQGSIPGAGTVSRTASNNGRGSTESTRRPRSALSARTLVGTQTDI